jgi:iron transport multicopper oxidase
MGQYPDGLRGPLIVHDPQDPYPADEELVLTTSDWYHGQAPGLLSQMFLQSNTQFLPPFPQACLLNDASSVKWNFVAGKTYKIRIISMAAFASTLLQFDSHTMRVIEADGTYIKKHDAYQLRIAPGQRYTILLNAHSTNRRNYAFTASLDMNRDFLNDPAPVYPFNVTGYIVYDESKSLPPPYKVDRWMPVNDATFEALDGQKLLGERDDADDDIRLDFNFGFDANGIPR